MTFHAATGQVVLFGGSQIGGFANDTWLWQGTTWTQALPASSPSARVFSAMAPDPPRGEVVLFGGIGPPTLKDTWVWNGSTWTQRMSNTVPAIQGGHGMVWDPARQRVLLLGVGPSGALDTWEWDGSDWIQRRPPTSPPFGSGRQIAYDEVRQRAVAFGTAPVAYEWDGTTWRPVVIASPMPRVSGAMAYHQAGGRTVLFGGNATPGLGDTWELLEVVAAQWWVSWATCQGTIGTLTLSAAPGSLPWFEPVPFVLTLAPLPSVTSVLGLIGTSATTWMGISLPYDLRWLGAPGCLLGVSPDIVLPIIPQGGAATWTISFPTDPTLVGKTLYLQGIAGDAVANALGLITSNGGAMTIGAR